MLTDSADHSPSERWHWVRCSPAVWWDQRRCGTSASWAGVHSCFVYTREKYHINKPQRCRPGINIHGCQTRARPLSPHLYLVSIFINFTQKLNLALKSGQRNQTWKSSGWSEMLFFFFYDFILKLLRKENSNYYYEIIRSSKQNIFYIYIKYNIISDSCLPETGPGGVLHKAAVLN